VKASPRAFRAPEALRAWLEKHGATAASCRSASTRSTHARKASRTRKPSTRRSASAGSTACAGSLDADSFSQRFSPRRPSTLWSKVNTKRMRELIAERRVRPAGMAAFERGTPSKYSFESRPSVLDPKFEMQLRRNTAAWRFWQSEPPGRRRLLTYFVMEAKQEETRARRFQKLLGLLERGRTLPMLERPKKR
jgi:hypothetical protein